MADDFVGVPKDDWDKARAYADLTRSLVLIALSLVVLVILALIQKGVLAGWADLIVRHG